MGVVSLLSERSARSPTSPGRVSERQVLPLLGLGRGCSQRTQKAFGTAMRLCASLFRGVAAPLGCVIFFAFVEIGICTSGAHGFPRVRGVGGITTLGALCVLLKYRTVACQSGSFAIFRGQVGVVPPHDSYFLANTQNFLLAVPVATLLRYGTISSTNWKLYHHLSLSFFEKIRLPDIPKDIPRHTPIPIPAILFKTFIKTTLQSIAAVIPIVTPIIILLLFISFSLHKSRFVA